MIVLLLFALLSAPDYRPFVAHSQRAFEEDFDLTHHYWRVPSHLRFARFRGTAAQLREIAERNSRLLAERDSGLSKFFALWKPDEPEKIFVPVFADLANFRDEPVWVVVFNWDYEKNGRMSARRILVVAARQSTGEVVIYQPDQ